MGVIPIISWLYLCDTVLYISGINALQSYFHKLLLHVSNMQLFFISMAGTVFYIHNSLVQYYLLRKRQVSFIRTRPVLSKVFGCVFPIKCPNVVVKDPFFGHLCAKWEIFTQPILYHIFTRE